MCLAKIMGTLPLAHVIVIFTNVIRNLRAFEIECLPTLDAAMPHAQPIGIVLRR